LLATVDREPRNADRARWSSRVVAESIALVLVLVVLMVGFDEPISRAVRDSDWWLRRALGALTTTGDAKWYLIPTGIGVLAATFLRARAAGRAARRLWGWCAAAAGFVFGAIALSGILVNVVKVLVGRPRPKLLDMEGALGFSPFTFDADFHSFPSGHANTLLALGLALAFLLPRYRRWFISIAAVLALSRVAVNAHYLSDLVAGGALAVPTTAWLRGRFAARGWAFDLDRRGRPRLAAPGRWLRAEVTKRLRRRP